MNFKLKKDQNYEHLLPCNNGKIEQLLNTLLAKIKSKKKDLQCRLM